MSGKGGTRGRRELWLYELEVGENVGRLRERSFPPFRGLSWRILGDGRRVRVEVGSNRFGGRRGVELVGVFEFLGRRGVRRETRDRGDGERRGGPGNLVVAALRRWRIGR